MPIIFPVLTIAGSALGATIGYGVGVVVSGVSVATGICAGAAVGGLTGCAAATGRYMRNPLQPRLSPDHVFAFDDKACRLK